MRVLLYDHPGSICSQMARLVLAEKGVAYARRTVDIMETAEQFQPWYVALNPKAVVPTLVHGDTVVIDTKRIVAYVDASFPGPRLTPPDPGPMHAWMDAIMGLHYGVLLYARRLDPDGTAPQIVERGRQLRVLRARHPEHAALLDARLAGNARLAAMLRDPDAVAEHVAAARALVNRMEPALARHRFLAGETWSLADAFATAALARFRIHGFAQWWSDGNRHVGSYYAAMRARPSFAAAEVIDMGSERDL